jgi:hypothetical protein
MVSSTLGVSSEGLLWSTLRGCDLRPDSCNCNLDLRYRNLGGIDMMYDVACRCPECGDLNFVRVNRNDYYNWKRGAMIQSAFPYLTSDQRELLMTGICNSCWDRMFGE